MSRLFPILLILFIAQGNALTFKETRRAGKIRLNALSVSTAESVIHYATTCAALVDKTLAVDNPPKEFIELSESPAAENLPPDSESRLFFSENTELHAFTFKIIRAFIRRRQKELFDGG